MKKIIGVVGSPRKGATEYIVEEALSEIRRHYEIETEIITLRGNKIAPCNHCDYCRKNESDCIQKDDGTDVIERLVQADGILIASPVYSMGPTPQLSALFTRMRPLFIRRPNPMDGIFGAAIAVGGTRNGGQEKTVDAIIHHMCTRGMIIVSNELGYYSGGFVWSRDLKREGAEMDERGMESVRLLAKKLARIVLNYNR